MQKSDLEAIVVKDEVDTSCVDAVAVTEQTTSLNAHLGLTTLEDPLSWPPGRKWLSTGIVLSMTVIYAFSASIYTSVIGDIADDLHCSRIVSTLGLSTFLLGFATGPLVFAPLSEVFGRNPIYRTTLLLFMAFTLGCALAPNIAGLLTMRFLAAFFGASSVSNTGGSITDLWAPEERSVPLALYTAASFLGPVIGPIVGGFISFYTSWRWAYWIVLTISGILYICVIVFLPETYAPHLAKKKGINSGALQAPISLKDKYLIHLTRPWIMLLTEPILLVFSLYMATVFGILYLDFTAYPIVFEQSRGWTAGQSGLSFLGIGVGMALFTACSPLLNRLHAHYVRKLGPTPEARLPSLIILAWFFPIAIFWFAWTATPEVHWIVPILSGIPFGIAFVALCLGIIAYLIDCYGPYAASALAANAVLRSLFGASFPLFAPIMYQKLGTPWATSILGFVSIGMAPLPLVLYVYGPRLRGISKFHLKTIAEHGS